MADEVKFENHTLEVKAAMDKAIIAFLHEASGELVSQTQRNTPVDTGQLKGSWDYKVNESKQESIIGSPLENAIWNEFGTGQYALKGDGRKTPWSYKDLKGKWHRTTGKRPRRSLQKAWDGTKGKIEKRLADILKGNLS